MVAPGRRLLGGRYALDTVLATGGMGQVWRGHDLLLGRPVAVKVLRSEYTGDPTFLARFRAEAQHTAALAHRNIAMLYDYGELTADAGSDEQLAYLVMELVDGEPLSTRLAREVRLPVAETLDLLQQTAAALATAHAAGVVHRDVKPGNVLLGADGVVKITDFGIAWSASAVPLTQTGQVVGTAHYLSPEQAGGGRGTAASDVYALGLIAYECLSGRRAFDGDNAVQIALRHLTDVPEPLPADVPDAVRSLVGRALLKDPDERYPDGAAFRDAVADVRAGRPLPPAAGVTTPLALRGPRHSATAPTGPRLRRTLASVATLALGAVIGAGALQLVGGPVAPGTATVVGTGQDGGGLPNRAVVVSAADYVGRPVDQVRQELSALGLDVQLVASRAADVPAGQVLAVSPAGHLRPGTTVRVTYTVAAAGSQASSTGATGATGPAGGGAAAPSGAAAPAGNPAAVDLAAVTTPAPPAGAFSGATGGRTEAGAPGRARAGGGGAAAGEDGKPEGPDRGAGGSPGRSGDAGAPGQGGHGRG